MSVRLSEKQQEVVEKTEGAALVQAAAGSGKTRVLTERIRYVMERKKGHYKVLALTFTNKAASEMKERLADIPDLDSKVFIGTIHAFCQMLLEAHGQTIGMVHSPVILEREADRLAVLEEVMLSNAILRPICTGKPEKERRKWLYDALAFISTQKRQLTGLLEGEDLFASDEEELVYRLYNERLISQGSIDFDDILLLAYRILTERANVAQLYSRIYKYICVDEAQDLNFAQYALIRTLAESNGNILMVGSPNQAIYGFNGSDTRYMLKDFVKDFLVTHYRLTENYRSAKAIIHAANTMFPLDAMDESSAPISGECLVEVLQGEAQEAAWVVAKIRELIGAGTHPDIETPLSLKSMVVLARNRYVFANVEAALEEAGVPYYQRRTSTDPVLESDFVQCFDLGLRMLVNPLDRLHYGQLCELVGCRPSSVTVTGNNNGIDQLSSLEFCIDEEWKHGFHALLTAWSSVNKDISTYGQTVDKLRQHCIGDNILNGEIEDAAERALILEDLEFLQENWRKYILATQPDARTLGHFRNQMAMGLTTPLEEREGIPLATVHSVKGLEYDVVFLVGMADGTFPDYRAVKQGGKALEEEKNEAYVAITRARRLLYITYPQNRVMPWDKASGTCTRQRPSRFLTGLNSSRGFGAR